MKGIALRVPPTAGQNRGQATCASLSKAYFPPVGAYLGHGYPNPGCGCAILGIQDIPQEKAHDFLRFCCEGMAHTGLKYVCRLKAPFDLVYQQNTEKRLLNSMFCSASA